MRCIAYWLTCTVKYWSGHASERRQPRLHNRLTICSPSTDDGTPSPPSTSSISSHSITTTMTILFFFLLFINILPIPVLADLTDDQVAIVKQRLAESAQARYSPRFYLQVFRISSYAIAGSSEQERRHFWSLTVLDTQSPHLERNFRLAVPTHHLLSTRFSLLLGASFPREAPSATTHSRSSKMNLPEIHRVSELQSFSRTGRNNSPLTVRTIPKHS